MQPHPADVERVRRATGTTPVAWRAASGHGARSNRRSVVDLGNGRSAFVKIAAYDYTAGWLRDEFRIYAALDGQPFLPRLIGWDDDGLSPVLALEDLSGATWPPPWDVARIDAVLASLASVHASRPPEGVPPAVESQFGRDGWPAVIADPEPFLSLGLCSPDWLNHLPTLAAASANAEIDGNSLLHFDVRSDNLCLQEGTAVLVDWNSAVRREPGAGYRLLAPQSRGRRRPGAARDPPGRDARDARDRVAAGRLLLRAGGSARDPTGSSCSPAPADAVEDGPAVGGSAPGPPATGLATATCTCNTLLLFSLVDVSYTDLMDQLRSRGLRMTPQRRAIVLEVMRAKGHISPTAIARKIQGDMPGVNASTVYRTLSLLESVGVLQHSHVETGAEYHRADEAHHVHLTCRNCGQDDELSLNEAEKLQGLIRRHHGFVADLTHFAITGLCADCAA